MHRTAIPPETGTGSEERKRDEEPEVDSSGAWKKALRLFRRGIRWASEVPFQKLLAASLSYLLPPGIPSFIVALLMHSVLAGVALAFGIFLILVAIRDVYWRAKQTERDELRQEVAEYRAERDETEKLLTGLLECFSQDWKYARLHASYWLDDDRTSGRFRRVMEVEFPADASVALSRLETMRIGAQGDGTELHPVRDLELNLECLTPGVKAFLVPLKRDEQDLTASEHFHNFTILLGSPQMMPRNVMVSLEGNWRGLWTPLWEKHIDYGSLLLSASRCEKLVVEVYAPRSAAEGEFDVKAAWPNVSFRKTERFDDQEKRFCHTLEATGATTGEYEWTVKHTERRSRSRAEKRKKNKTKRRSTRV